MSAAVGERQSPGWRKPSDVMKIRKKKKVRKSSSSSISELRQNSVRVGSSPQRPGIVLKRRNPFGCGGGVAAVRRLSDVDASDSSQEQKTLSPNSVQREEDGSAVGVPSYEPLKKVEDRAENNENTIIENGEITVEDTCHRSDTCPIDWCLHTRLRFTSEASFDWSSRISSTEEGRGLTNFVRCSTTPSQQDGSITEDSVFRERLKQSTMVWSSPSLPWFKSFPRIVPESKDARTTFIVKEENVQKSLMTQWFESFCSVYQLLRAGICPYFYVCAHHLTILFRARHVAGKESIHAFLGPTTRGFRESLKAEGVTFTMPLLVEESAKHQDPHQKIGDRKDDEDPASPSRDSGKREEEEVGADEDAASWLQSIGLDNFLEVNTHRVQLQADTSAKQDNRPQSVLYVEGLGNVQALYNFILNYKNIVATVGLQAGIPPTILAPLAFHGATLSSCKVKSGCLRQVVGQRVNDIHTLDVSGPILAHSVHQLMQLLSETQQGQFNAAFQAHGPTGAFTAASHRTFKRPGEDDRNTHSCAGFSQGFIEELYRPENVIEKAWKELRNVKGEYQWT